jgi:RNA polymerase sigma factor (sigma-70 family)
MESPFSSDWAPVFDETPPAKRHSEEHAHQRSNRRPPQPETDLQALMEAPPFVEPDSSKAANLALRRRLHDAVDALIPREKWIFEAYHYRELSFRQIAEEMGISKTTADRVYREALAHLREMLIDG